MPSFAYTARTRNGERTEGVLQAGDRRDALARLSAQGMAPISVKESASAAAKPGSGKKIKGLQLWSGRQQRMKLREVLTFSRELSDLISSGMTLGSALKTLSKRDTGSYQDELTADLHNRIVEGSSLSDALAHHPESFPAFYVSMVRAGEASGQLTTSLSNLCEHYERLHEAREKVTGALVYPIIVLVVGIGTVIFCMLFVVPRFAIIFEDLGSTLPLPTRMLIGFSDVMLRYGWLILLACVGMGISLSKALKTEAGRYRWHKIQLKIPVIKNIVTANAFSHFARTLGGLLENGVPVLKALDIVQDTSGNVVIAEQIREAKERVTDGATISTPLSQGDVFPSLLTDMLSVGEESGNVPGSLAHIAKRYDDDLNRHLKVFTTVLEPLLMLFMAGMVGFVAVSMLMAVFEMTNGLQI